MSFAMVTKVNLTNVDTERHFLSGLLFGNRILFLIFVTLALNSSCWVLFTPVDVIRIFIVSEIKLNVNFKPKRTKML